jgi:hypothetical protein
MAVSRYLPVQSGVTTPESVPSTPVASSFDQDDVSFEERMCSNVCHRFVFLTSGINVIRSIILLTVCVHRLWAHPK